MLPGTVLLSMNIMMQTSGLRLCSRDGCTTTGVFKGANYSVFGGVPKCQHGRSAILVLEPYFPRRTS